MCQGHLVHLMSSLLSGDFEGHLYTKESDNNKPLLFFAFSSMTENQTTVLNTEIKKFLIKTFRKSLVPSDTVVNHRPTGLIVNTFQRCNFRN